MGGEGSIGRYRIRARRWQRGVVVDDETQRTDEGSEAEAEAVDEHDAAA